MELCRLKGDPTRERLVRRIVHLIEDLRMDRQVFHDDDEVLYRFSAVRAARIDLRRPDRYFVSKRLVEVQFLGIGVHTYGELLTFARAARHLHNDRRRQIAGRMQATNPDPVRVGEHASLQQRHVQHIHGGPEHVGQELRARRRHVPTGTDSHPRILPTPARSTARRYNRSSGHVTCCGTAVGRGTDGIPGSAVPGVSRLTGATPDAENATANPWRHSSTPRCVRVPAPRVGAARARLPVGSGEGRPRHRRRGRLGG